MVRHFSSLLLNARELLLALVESLPEREGGGRKGGRGGGGRGGRGEGGEEGGGRGGGGREGREGGGRGGREGGVKTDKVVANILKHTMDLI